MIKFDRVLIQYKYHKHQFTCSRIAKLYITSQLYDRTGYENISASAFNITIHNTILRTEKSSSQLPPKKKILQSNLNLNLAPVNLTCCPTQTKIAR